MEVKKKETEERRKKEDRDRQLLDLKGKSDEGRKKPIVSEA